MRIPQFGVRRPQAPLWPVPRSDQRAPSQSPSPINPPRVLRLEPTSASEKRRPWAPQSKNRPVRIRPFGVRRPQAPLWPIPRSDQRPLSQSRSPVNPPRAHRVQPTSAGEKRRPWAPQSKNRPGRIPPFGVRRPQAPLSPVPRSDQRPPRQSPSPSNPPRSLRLEPTFAGEKRHPWAPQSKNGPGRIPPFGVRRPQAPLWPVPPTRVTPAQPIPTTSAPSPALPAIVSERESGA